MGKQKLRFSIDYGCCLWGNDGGISNNSLPISNSLTKELDDLLEEFDTSLDWNYPPDPSPWTKEQFIEFFDRAAMAYQKLQSELGSDYEIINNLENDKAMYMGDRVFAASNSSKINKINLIIDGEINTHNLRVFNISHTEDGEVRGFRLGLNIGGIEYINDRDFSPEGAVRDMQKQLPDNILIACCQTCKHGNYNPLGDYENEIYCLLSYIPREKADVVYIIATATRSCQPPVTGNELLHTSVATGHTSYFREVMSTDQSRLLVPVNELLYYCDNYDRINKNYYTYNDWLYYIKE